MSNSKVVLPDQLSVYRSIEGLIQHFELIMTNRQWQPPVDEVYAAIESPNGELGYYVVADGSGVAYRTRTRPPSFIHFAIFPVFDCGPSAERRGGGAGQSEHHRGGVGSMSVLTEELRQKILAYLPRYPSKQAVTLPALHIVQDALRHVPLEAIREIADLLDLSPAEVHDTMTFYGFFRDKEHPLGQTRLWVCRSLACGLRGGG